ncbi:MAG: flavodoxin family protein [Gammaproteobacteria bacterium]|nr:flavodoxin family protein [Gammaproteobacteria bacterium]
MKIVAIVGSGHGLGGNTARLLDRLCTELRRRCTQQQQAFELDHILTDELMLGASCAGCLDCITAGEQTCPKYGCMERVRQLMEAADLVIFATPVHSFHVSASIKRFVDHFAYQIHRPRHVGQYAVILSTAMGAGHKPAMGYLADTVKLWGFVVLGQLGTHAPSMDKPAYLARLGQDMGTLATRIVTHLDTRPLPRPGLRDLIAFRVARIIADATAEASEVDRNYWRERGWLHSDWFAPARINPVANLLAAMVEAMIRKAMARGLVRPVLRGITG